MTNNETVPPLGLQPSFQPKSNQIGKRLRKRKYWLMVVGGLLLTGIVVVGRYEFLKQTTKVAEIKPSCSSLMPQDCETVPGCKLETKEVKLSSKCDSLMPQDCETVPGCKLETKTQTKTITKQCTPGDCDHPGCNKKIIEVGGRCLCDPASEAAGRVLTTKSQCDQYKDDGCSWIPKNQTECSGQYKIDRTYTNEYCTGTAKYTNEYCVVDPNYKPNKPKPRPEQTTPASPKTNSSNGCNQNVNRGCGAAPEGIPNYHKTAKLGPFEKDGKLVLLFYPLDVKGGGSGVLKAIVSYEGKDYPIEIGKPGKQRIVTDIQVKAGTTATLTKVIEHKQQDACAPKQPTPQQGIGWIPVNNDLTCGSGLPGPPQGGACTPFKKLSVKEAISWAESFGQPILSKECWADWMEWPGDYDFNDYFLMFAVEPTGPELTCSSLTKDKETIVVGDKVKFVCQGQSENQIKPDYQFRYRILKKVDGKLDDSGYQIVGKDSYVGSNMILLEMKEPGDYTVECRLCDAKGENCTAKWKPTKILK